MIHKELRLTTSRRRTRVTRRQRVCCASLQFVQMVLLALSIYHSFSNFSAILFSNVLLDRHAKWNKRCFGEFTVFLFSVLSLIWCQWSFFIQYPLLTALLSSHINRSVYWTQQKHKYILCCIVILNNCIYIYEQHVIHQSKSQNT